MLKSAGGAISATIRAKAYQQISNTELTSLQQQRERKQIQAVSLDSCLSALEEVDRLQAAFSDALWNTVLDHVTVYADERLVFHFKIGIEITVQT